MQCRLLELIDHFAHGAQHALDRRALVSFIRGLELNLEALLGGVKALDDLALILIELAHALPAAEKCPAPTPWRGAELGACGRKIGAQRLLKRHTAPRRDEAHSASEGAPLPVGTGAP